MRVSNVVGRTGLVAAAASIVLMGAVGLNGDARASSGKQVMASEDHGQDTDRDLSCLLPLTTSPPFPPDVSLDKSAQGQFHRIVMRFHVIRRANGSGGIDERLIDRLMRDVNVGFRDSPFRFVREPGVVYIDNDVYYNDFPTYQAMIPMLDGYYQPGLINWYLVPSIGGGQFVGSVSIGTPFTAGARGIVLTTTPVGQPTNIVTPPHEVGHLLHLWHPFETGFGTECVRRSNCGNAGDLLCDTPASPIVHGGNTTGTGIYFGTALGPCSFDPVFSPDTRLYMEAGWPAGHILRDRFSPEQHARMLTHFNAYTQDLIGPGRPEVLVDCDQNGLDDLDEILDGTREDINQDLVLDDCEVRMRPGDLVVAGMNPDASNRPRIYDGTNGSYRGDFWNGLTWTHQLRFGPDGFIYMARLSLVVRLDINTGRSHDVFVDGVREGAQTFTDLLFNPRGDLLVLDNVSANIRRYSGDTGEFIGVFADIGATGMSSPKYMEYGPFGHIYVVGNGALGNTIQAFDQNTGASLGSLITPGAGGLIAGQGITYHDGLLYVSNAGGNNILTYAFGGFQGQFVPGGSGGLSNPHSLRFGPDGHLYVASRNSNAVKRYNGTNGAFMGNFVSTGSGGGGGFGGLIQPAGLLFCGGRDVDDLRLSHTGGVAGSTRLTWSVPGGETALLRFDTLAAAAGNGFDDPSTSDCVEIQGTDTESIDDGAPASGEVRYFLVRPETACGSEDGGKSSNGEPRVVRTCT